MFDVCATIHLHAVASFAGDVHMGSVLVLISPAVQWDIGDGTLCLPFHWTAMGDGLDQVNKLCL